MSLQNIANHYSRICHSINLSGKGYGFPYDDVSPSNSSTDQSGSISDPNPELLTVAVGGADAPSMHLDS
jgi:Beta-1,3-glucanase